MKILKLNFKNINSLKGENNIDFTISPLVDTGIFAITGVTGSGKSTILDVITLALFNRTPRFHEKFSKNNIDQYGAIITRNTTECYAEIEYSANGKNYRSKWSIHKARSGKMQDYNMELTDLDSDKILDIKKSEIPEKNEGIIGLNYEQFTKSILLSQGEFAKFLKASAKERSKLFEKITGTDIYRTIGKTAYEHFKTEKIKLEQIEIKLNSFSLLTDEEIENLSLQIKEIEHILEKTGIEKDDFLKMLNLRTEFEKLKKEKEKLKKEEEIINIDRIRLNTDNKRLSKHKKLINIKSEILEIKEKTKRIELLNKILKNLEQEKKHITDKINFQTKELNETSSLLEKSIYEKEKTEPILKETEKLDVEISNFEKNIEQIKKRIIIENKKVSSLKLDIGNIENGICEITENISNEKKWLSENDILKTLKIELFEEKNKSYKFENKELNRVIDKLKSYDENFTIDFNNQKKINKKIDLLKIKEQKNNSDIYEIEQKLKSKKNSLEEVELFLEKNNFRLEKTNYLISISKQFENQTTKKNSLIEENNRDAENLILENGNLKKWKIEEEILTKQKEELEIRVERQVLEAKYSDDRKKLKENEACFLCGSTLHPYVKNYVDLLNETEKNLKNTNKKINIIKKNISNIEKNISAINSKTSTNERNIAILSKEENEFKALFLIESKDLDKYLEITDFQKINNLKNNLEETQKEYIEQKKLLKDLEKYQQEKSILQEINNQLNKIYLITEDIKEFYEEFDKYIAKVKPDKAIEILKEKLNQVEDKTLKINDLSIRLEQQKTSKKEKGQTVNLLNEDLNDILKELDKISGQKDVLSKKRYSILEDKNPDKIRTQINSRIDNLKEGNNKINIQLVENKTNIENVLNVKDEKNKEIEVLKEAFEDKNKKLTPILNSLGYNSYETALSNILSEEEADKIQNKIDSFREKEIENQKLLTEIEKNIFNYKEIDNQNYNINYLNEKIKFITEDNQKKNQDLGRIKEKFRKNKETQKQVTYIEEEKKNQEKEKIRWGKLNDLIGDATGDKFVKFTQELTLMQVIYLANKYLQQFTKRYLLDKKLNENKDEIIVIDTYLANTERSVRTLSGGESFIVSMSLALGLSDLAGNNTKIESLFIDEGFGSLDQATLDIALSTLEKLQLESNRTIGIISHVESLKERIRTQIELKKTNSGYSEIIIN